MQEGLERYILSHIAPEPEPLRKLYRDTHLYRLYPRMCSGHLQGRILKMLTAMINPRRVLELGTYSGYSALCMAEALRPGAELHTVEIDDEAEAFIARRFRESAYADWLFLHIGDAFDVVPRLDGMFDMVFIDANKRHYADYYRMVLPRVAQGGYIVADNTLWDGKVVSVTGEEHTDAQTKGIMLFNDIVAADPAVECVIVPLRDGLTILRKL